MTGEWGECSDWCKMNRTVTCMHSYGDHCPLDKKPKEVRNCCHIKYMGEWEPVSESTWITCGAIHQTILFSYAAVLCGMWHRHQTEDTTLREGLQVGGAGCTEAQGAHQRLLLHHAQGTQADAAQVQEGVQDQLPVEFVELDGLLQGLFRRLSNAPRALRDLAREQRQRATLRPKEASESSKNMHQLYAKTAQGAKCGKCGAFQSFEEINCKSCFSLASHSAIALATSGVASCTTIRTCAVWI